MELLNKIELLNKLKDKYNDNWPPEIAEGFQKAVDIVEDTPTVEATPIEWLKNELISKAEKLGATDYVNNIRFVLEDWEAWKKYHS